MRSIFPRSLYWTFAGAFLLVLLVAGILQGVIVVAVVEPLAERWMVDRGRVLAREVAVEIGKLSAPSDDAVREVLRARAPRLRGTQLLFRAADGHLVTERFLPHSAEQRLAAWIDSGGTGGLPPGGPDSSFGEEPRPPPPDLRPPFAWRGGRPGLGDRSFWRRVKIVDRIPVESGGAPRGEIVVLTAERPFSLLPSATPRPILIALPVAILLAGIAALVMFRAIVRRLRALEMLATRVTQGDLAARVPDPGADEIGRLGARLNEMTEALSLARQRLEDTDRQRRRLLADVSHDLATPLTSIRGYAETLLDPDVPVSAEERVVYLRNVLEESERIRLLIQDIFELARLESGAIELKKERLDWAALCRNTAARFEIRYRDASLALEWRGGDAEAWVEADGRRLEQVAENLLANGLRHVPAGGRVTLSMERVAGAGEMRHRLTVSDDGPGIPPADLPHVFDRFFRADPSRSAPGSGLGLSIVKEIVQKHGGSVRAENRSPHGTSIVVELAAAAPVEAA